jgi:hypothetical protein
VLGQIAQVSNELGARLPVWRFVVPFTNIVANVVNESLNYTPIGSIRALAGQYLGAGVYGKPVAWDWADRETLADLHAKAAMGTLLFSTLFLMAAELLDDDDPVFAITGKGPTDKGKRDTLLEAGWQPNSVKIGPYYVSYLQTPGAVPLAAMGNMLDGLKYGHLEEASGLDRAAYAAKQMARSIMDQSFLDSVARLIGLIERPTEKRLAENMADWAARTASSFVAPNLVRQMDRIFDPKVYDDPGVAGALLGQMPFVRRAQAPALNGLGEQIERPWQRYVAPEGADQVWRELARLQVGLYPREMVWRAQVLTDEEKYEVVRLSGPRIRRHLEGRLERIRRLPDEQGRALVQEIVEAERERAKALVMGGK